MSPPPNLGVEREGRISRKERRKEGGGKDIMEGRKEGYLKERRRDIKEGRKDVVVGRKEGRWKRCDGSHHQQMRRAIFIHDASISHILPAMKVGFLRLRPREGIVKYGKRSSLLVKARERKRAGGRWSREVFPSRNPQDSRTNWDATRLDKEK